MNIISFFRGGKKTYQYNLPVLIHPITSYYLRLYINVIESIVEFMNHTIY
jgi:hypothetical protein